MNWFVIIPVAAFLLWLYFRGRALIRGQFESLDV